MKTKSLLFAGIALSAILAVGIPTVMAESEKYAEFEDTFNPDITGSIPAPETIRASVDAATISVSQVANIVDQRIEGTIVSIYLYEHSDFLVYFVELVTANEYFEVIVDAGTGAILHQSDKVPLEVVEELLAEYDAYYEDWYYDYEWWYSEEG